MSQFMRYTCNAESLPIIQAALLAKGYTLAGAQRAQGNNGVAEIEVWGAAQSAVATVFEALPIELHRLPPRRSALR